MAYVIPSKSMRALEQVAVDNGASYAQLMETAGTAVARWIKQHCLTGCSAADRTVMILCGTGNNGGDGFVAASLLHQWYPQLTVHVVLTGLEPTASPAKEMFERLQADERLVLSFWNSQESCLIPLNENDILVDAVYGIGFHGELPPSIKELFDLVRGQGAYTVAIDIPSGMQADADRADPAVLHADATVTFTAMKPCMLSPATASLCGEIVTVSVGIDTELVSLYRLCVQKLTQETAAKGFRVRPADSHKGTFGRVFALCGSYGMAGAAMLCGKAALRCGVGLLHLFIPESIYPIVASQLWEAVCHPLEETVDNGLTASSLKTLRNVTTAGGMERAAALIGPGLSRNKCTAELMLKWLSTLAIPTVIDADGLNVLSEHIDVLKATRKSGLPTVLTPHPAEAARMLECDTSEVEADRLGAAVRLAKLCGGVAVLKGHHTVVASASGEVYVNTTGCSGLATGGSGDVLTGMIAAFLANGTQPLQAALTAVYLHGLASVHVRARLSETGMLPTDLLEELPVLLSQFELRE